MFWHFSFLLQDNLTSTQTKLPSNSSSTLLLRDPATFQACSPCWFSQARISHSWQSDFF